MAAVTEFGDDWKQIGERLGLKTKRETILEFLRAPMAEEDRGDHQYLVDVACKQGDLKQPGPYSQADLLFL